MEKSDPKRPASPPSRPAASAPPSSGRPASPASGGSTGASPAGRPWLLRKRGSLEVLRCPDLSTLRTWMLERRISRDDEISRGGKVYRRLGSVVEFESLFHSADAERAQRRRIGTQATPASTPAAALSAAPRSGAAKAPLLSASLGGAAGAAPSLSKVSVSNPGLTPTASNMSPLRITPSGQPARPRLPQAAPSLPPSMIAASPPAQSAAPSQTASPAPGSTQAATQGGQTQGQSQGQIQAPGRPAPPPPLGSAAARALLKPLPPPKEAVPEQEIEDTDESAGQPTTRFQRVEPTRPLLTTGTSEKTPPSETSPAAVPFELAETEEVEPSKPVALPPQLTEPVPIKLPEPIEQALRRSDPVPRHLKEAADPDRTARIQASVEHTERFERSEGRRGLMLFAGSLAITGVLVFALQQASKPDTPPAGGDDTTTAPVATSLPTERPRQGTETSGTGAASEQAGSPNVGAGGAETPPAADPAGAAARSSSTLAPATNASPGASAPQANLAPAASPAASAAAEAPKAAPLPTLTPKPAAPPAAPPAEKPAAPAAVSPSVSEKPAAPPQAAPAASVPAKPAAPAAAAPPAPTKPAAPTSGSKKVVVTEIPKTFDKQMELAQQLVEHEQFDAAQRLFETILSYAPHVPAVHVGLGKCALEQGRAGEAIEHYRNALSRLASYGPAIFGLAKAYRQRGDKEQAVIYYKKYLEMNPNGSGASSARDAIAKLEGGSSSSELVKPPQQTRDGSELVKPQ